MLESKKPRRTWKELEATEKLGYAWVAIYFILIVATALTIIVPAYKKWQIEHAEKQGSLAPAGVSVLAALPSKEAHHGPLHSFSLIGEALGVSHTPRLG